MHYHDSSNDEDGWKLLCCSCWKPWILQNSDQHIRETKINHFWWEKIKLTSFCEALTLGWVREWESSRRSVEPFTRSQWRRYAESHANPFPPRRSNPVFFISVVTAKMLCCCRCCCFRAPSSFRVEKMKGMTSKKTSRFVSHIFYGTTINANFLKLLLISHLSSSFMSSISSNITSDTRGEYERGVKNGWKATEKTHQLFWWYHETHLSLKNLISQKKIKKFIICPPMHIESNHWAIDSASIPLLNHFKVFWCSKMWKMRWKENPSTPVACKLLDRQKKSILECHSTHFHPFNTRKDSREWIIES